MACNCPEDTHDATPVPAGTRHEVLSDGRVVFRSSDLGKAEEVATRWPGGTVRSVDNSTPYSDT